MPKISHILETCIYGQDLRAMEAFYTNVLGLETMSVDHPRYVFFRVDSRSVLLIFDPRESAKVRDVPSHGSTGTGHVALAVEHDDLDTWRTQLAQHDVDIEQELTWGNGARSIYFRDPAGNSVELVTPEIWTA
jgi:catechol-2,3-dioxygenase